MRGLIGLAAAALAALAALAWSAAAAPMDCVTPPMHVWQGSLHPGARCGAFVIATDAGATRRSYARVLVEARLPYRLSLRARRLTGDSGAAVELELQGGYFLWKDGAWGVYFNEAQFERDGWQPLAGLDSRREHQVVVERFAGGFSVSLDGTTLGRWNLAGTAGDGPSIALSGRAGSRAKLLVRDLAVTPLPPDQRQ